MGCKEPCASTGCQMCRLDACDGGSMLKRLTGRTKRLLFLNSPADGAGVCISSAHRTGPSLGIALLLCRRRDWRQI